MLEVFFLVLIVIVVLLVFFFIFGKDDYETKAFVLENDLSFEKEKLKIAERKFLQGKIKKDVFDPLLDELESEITEKELELYGLKKKKDISAKEKLGALLGKVERPTGIKKAKLEKLLKESELIRSELGLLEVKLMKRQIKENVFRKLVGKKEKEMIEIESEILRLMTEKKN